MKVDCKSRSEQQRAPLGPSSTATQSKSRSPLGPAQHPRGASELISASSFWMRLADEHRDADQFMAHCGDCH